MKRGRPSPASERRTFRAISGAMKLYASVRLDGKLPIVRDPFIYVGGVDIDAVHPSEERAAAVLTELRKEKDKKNG